MKRMKCPLNGWRNIGEFVYGGEVRPAPAADAGTAAWADWVFMLDNRAGVVREWWLHAPSSYWFIAERDTATDTLIESYPPETLFAEGGEFGGGGATS